MESSVDARIVTTLLITNKISKRPANKSWNGIQVPLKTSSSIHRSSPEETATATRRLQQHPTMVFLGLRDIRRRRRHFRTLRCMVGLGMPTFPRLQIRPWKRPKRSINGDASVVNHFVSRNIANVFRPMSFVVTIVGV